MILWSHKVIDISSYISKEKPSIVKKYDLVALLNGYGMIGYGLVSIDNGMAYLKKKIEAELSSLTDKDIRQQIKLYEKVFSLESDDFLQLLQDGKIGNTFETNDWQVLLRCLDER